MYIIKNEIDTYSVFFMPGMAANSKIFEFIKLPKNFKLHYLEWYQPEVNDDLSSYVNRLSKKIHGQNIILVGQSFGGIIVQEISKIINVKKVIIVSSVKSHKEFPKLFQFAKDYDLDKPIPYSLFDSLIKNSVKLKLNKFYKRIDLAEKYLTEREEYYLKWAVDNLLRWKNDGVKPNLIHIHGTKDKIFPIKNIDNCIEVEGGNHEMIIIRAKWFNENLEKIISTN